MALTNALDPSKHGPKVAMVEWKIVSTASGLAVGLVVRRLVNWAWSTLSPSDHEPPLNPADQRISWSEAVAWAAAAGAGVGVARLVSERVAASGWELATGDAPPGVDD
jgi:hypothetical protein